MGNKASDFSFADSIMDLDELWNGLQDPLSDETREQFTSDATDYEAEIKKEDEYLVTTDEDVEAKKAEIQEQERKEIERKEIERQELERQEQERKELERQEQEKREAEHNRMLALAHEHMDEPLTFDDFKDVSDLFSSNAISAGDIFENIEETNLGTTENGTTEIRDDKTGTTEIRDDKTWTTEIRDDKTGTTEIRDDKTGTTKTGTTSQTFSPEDLETIANLVGMDLNEFSIDDLDEETLALFNELKANRADGDDDSQEAERLEQERLEAERLERERLERERQEAEKRKKLEQIKQKALEKLEADKKAKADRLAAEKLEQERQEKLNQETQSLTLDEEREKTIGLIKKYSRKLGLTVDISEDDVYEDLELKLNGLRVKYRKYLKKLKEQEDKWSRTGSNIDQSNNATSKNPLPVAVDIANKTVSEHEDELKAYSEMNIDDLFKVVKQYLLAKGVKNKLVSLDEVVTRFGRDNVKRLRDKNYIIVIRNNGITLG